MAATIHLIDDDEPFRKAVSRMLRAAGYSVETYSSTGDFMLSHSGDDPACLLLDIQMPGPSGLDLQAALASKGKSIPVIFLTGHATIALTVRAMKAGAIDLLTKPVDKEQILNAVARALAVHHQESALRTELDHWNTCLESLTPRQHQVFASLVKGKLNKQMAADFGISERTVKAHRAQVMEKMKVESVAQLVSIYYQLQFSTEKRPVTAPE
jgi:FixJ family two-component response regulator